MISHFDTAIIINFFLFSHDSTSIFFIKPATIIACELLKI